MSQPNSSRRAFVVVLLGVLLLQTAWVFVVPPFRGLDEHDHAYKAAATARGDIDPRDREASAQGWGSFMSVPRDLVEAAGPVCEEFAYTTPDNCRPGPSTGSGQVRVASSAASYNPALYFVLGTAARPFAGTGALYAMRATAALLCALVLTLGFMALRRLARSPLLPATALLALTPMVVYSTAVAAPNGLELAAGFLTWAALLCALHADLTPREKTRWTAAATLGAAVLVTLRPLGPVWLLLIIGVVVVWSGWAAVVALLRRRPALVGAALVVALTVLAGVWILAARPNDFDSSVNEFDDPLWKVLPQQWVVWFFQSVAAIPARDEIVPIPVYMIVFPAWVIVTAVALRLASRRQRVALGLVFSLSSIIPLVATAHFYSSLGTAWQGRYTLPFTLGFFVLCGLLLDARLEPGARLQRAVVLGVGAVIASATIICQLYVLRDQLDTSPLAGTRAWPAPAEWQVVALTVGGMALLLTAILSAGPGAPRRDRRSRPARPGHPTAPATPHR